MPKPVWVLLLTMSIRLDNSVPISFFQQNKAPCHRSQICLKLDSWIWQRVHCTQMASIVTWSRSIRALGCAEIGDYHHVYAVNTLQHLCDTNMDKIYKECLQHCPESMTLCSQLWPIYSSVMHSFWYYFLLWIQINKKLQLSQIPQPKKLFSGLNFVLDCMQQILLILFVWFI